MLIGELAARTGASPRSLRYYEQVGLLEPERTFNGYRIYSESDVARVWQIRWLFGAGLSSAQVRVALPLIQGHSQDVTVHPALASELAPVRASLTDELARLRGVLERLDGVLELALRPASPPAERLCS
jgi:DNA-binding transcriptional MerR regulator